MFYMILWGVILIIMVIAELSTLQMISIWFAAGALGAFIASFFISFVWQFAIFTILSALLLILTRPFFKKVAKSPQPTNAELDIGKSAVVIEEIDSVKGTGRASLNGVDWRVVSNTNEVIPKDSVVTVEAIQGSKLLVCMKKN